MIAATTAMNSIADTTINRFQALMWKRKFMESNPARPEQSLSWNGSRSEVECLSGTEPQHYIEVLQEEDCVSEAA
jgi:hypothetical protein